MTWEVFGMSGKFKLFQWWSQVVEFDTKHLNVVGISFAQVCLSLPHSNLPNKGSWAPRARGYSCAQALPLCSSTSRRRCALCGARGLLFHSALARFWPSRARWHKPAWPFSEDFHRIFCLIVRNTLHEILGFFFCLFSLDCRGKIYFSNFENKWSYLVVLFVINH